MSGMEDFFRSATDELFPKMKTSAISLTIFSGAVDPKLCMELGAAILFDKPLVLVVPDSETVIPNNLKRVASAIVVGDPSDPDVQHLMRTAIMAVIDNDQRARTL